MFIGFLGYWMFRSTHILHLSFSESDKCFTVPLFGKNERSTKK